ncbi:hypothetical protein BDW72DRAFT_207848 [Aspergillus terricola var. indicus]
MGKSDKQEPELSDWTRAIIEAFITQHGEEIKKELQEANPDFSKIKSLLGRLNEAITNANREHQAPQELNIVRVDVYQQTYDAWKARVNSDHVKGNTKEEWKAYYELRKMFRLINRQNHLPEEWNIPSATAEQLFGAKPSGIEELPDDAESAASYSDESESEESESDEVEGIDALEARMRKEYSSLSRGKVLYWWPVGMGTQIFVRYGPKKSPIYRVRAGSSLPYDPRSTEQVLSKTRGNAKIRVQAEGTVKEVWKYTRDDVQDIIGVGWKVEDDDDTSANALAFIRPAKDIIYPHTRVLVKWKLGAVSLERRGFVRRITNGGGLSGDRMIYLKAREMENAYWGYDVEEEETDDETSESEDSSSDESSYTRSRRARRSIRTHPKRSDKNEQSDADSETSPSDQEQAPRRSKRLNRKKRGKSSRAKKDVDKEIRRLTEELTRLKLKQRGRQTSRRDRT